MPEASPDDRDIVLGPDPDDVQDLLVVRPGDLADVVRAIPALRHLRRTYPKARISAAVTPDAATLLDGCPYADRCIDLTQPSELLVEHFDLAVDFSDPRRPAQLPPIMATFTVGWRSAGNPETLDVHPEWPTRRSSAARMVRLVWLLGGGDPQFSLAMWPSLADRNGAARLVAGCTKAIAVVHVGVARRGFASILQLLHAHGFDLVLVGDGDAADRAAVDAVETDIVHRTGTHTPLVDAVGSATVGLVCGLLERAELFVGIDRGPAALAAALGVRSVIIDPESVLEYDGVHGCVHLVVPREGTAASGFDTILSRVDDAAATAMRSWHARQIST